jgi:hypothetical protein
MVEDYAHHAGLELLAELDGLDLLKDALAKAGPVVFEERRRRAQRATLSRSRTHIFS